MHRLMYSKLHEPSHSESLADAVIAKLAFLTLAGFLLTIRRSPNAWVVGLWDALTGSTKPDEPPKP
jgi:hypothetical protein